MDGGGGGCHVWNVACVSSTACLEVYIIMIFLVHGLHSA